MIERFVGEGADDRSQRIQWLCDAGFSRDALTELEVGGNRLEKTRAEIVNVANNRFVKNLPPALTELWEANPSRFFASHILLQHVAFLTDVLTQLGSRDADTLHRIADLTETESKKEDQHMSVPLVVESGMAVYTMLAHFLGGETVSGYVEGFVKLLFSP
jgi:hypothetical protein